MPGRERDRWEKNLKLPTMVRAIQTKNEKKLRDSYWTTNQRRNNHQERMECKRKKYNKFFWALGAEATHQLTRSEYRTEPDKIKNDKLINSYNRYYLRKRNEYNSRGDFFGRSKQTRKHGKATGTNCTKVLECDFPEISNKLLISKFITSITYWKLRVNC